MIKTMPREAALEQVMKDYEHKDAILATLPEISPVSGNPVRAVVEQMVKNCIDMLQGKLLLPAGAQEAGDTMQANVPVTTGQIFPILARVFADDIAFDLVTLQPMTQPTGLAMWINELYGSAEAGSLPDAIAVGDRMDTHKTRDYSDSSDGADANKVSISISQATLNTSMKALKAHVTPAAMQDLPVVAGVDAVATINGVIARALRREIGQMIIYQLVTYASAGNANWDPNAPAGSTVLNIQAHKRTLWESIIDASVLVYEKIYKMPNFVCTTPANFARLQKTLENFQVNPALGAMPNIMQGRYLAGTTDSGMRCYVDPWFPATDKFLIGYKGATWLDAGAGFFSYIPLWWTPEFYDPDDGGKWKRYAMTRFGKIASADDSTAVVGTGILNSDFFATVTVTAS